MKKRSIGIIGSAFNPPHKGHQDIIEQIYSEFDEILLIPSYRHAFGKQMESFENRLYMTSLLTQDFHAIKNIAFKPILTSSIEKDIGFNNSTAVYTFDVLEELEQRYLCMNIEADLTFIIGPDNATHDIWNKFYRGSEIIDRWQLKVVNERMPIRSSIIRQYLLDHQQPRHLIDTQLKKFVNKAITDHIYQQQLYGVFK